MMRSRSWMLGFAAVLALSLVAVSASAEGARDLTGMPSAALSAPADLSPAVYGPLSPESSATIYTSRAQFDAAFPGLTSEDFEDAVCPGIVGFPAPLDSTTSNACFSPGNIPAGLDIRDEPLNDAGGGSANGLAFVQAGQAGALNDAMVANTFIDAFRLNFSPSVAAVGMEMANFVGAAPMRVRFYSGMNLLEEINLPSVGPAGGFLGIYALEGITQVELLANNGAPGDGAEGVYEVLFGGSPGGDWVSVDSLNTGRSRPAAVFFPPEGNFYVLGGESTGGDRNIPIERYNPTTDTWTDRALLNTGVSNVGAATVGNLIYVPGGWTGSVGVSDLQIYSPSSNLVTAGPVMPAANFAHAVVARGQFVHVLGGAADGSAGTTHFVYDTVAGSWTTAAPVPLAVQYPAAASDGDYVYLLGGNTTNSDAVFRYDPVANSWSGLPNLLEGRGGPGAFFDGRNLWAVGGGWATYLTTTEYFDGVAWHPGPTLNTGARTLGVAFGYPLALRAAGWAAAYLNAAEILDFTLFADGFETGNTTRWSSANP